MVASIRPGVNAEVVIDLETFVARDDVWRGVCKLEVDDGLEVFASVEPPAALDTLCGKAMSAPECVEIGLMALIARGEAFEPLGECAVVEVIVDDARHAARADDSLELVESWLAARSPEVGEACMDDVDALVGEHGLCGAASEDRCVHKILVCEVTHGDLARGAVGFDGEDVRGFTGDVRHPEACTRAEIHDELIAPVLVSSHRGEQEPLWVERPVFYLVWGQQCTYILL